MATIDDQIGTRWKWRGISPGPARDQPTDPSSQSWTELEQPGTPQQKNFVHGYETSLACGIYTVLSSLYAVRNWKIDFVQQSHIKNARNWMAAACHAIKEVVCLNWCGCGERYEHWGSRPTPPCPTCEKFRMRKTAPDERKTREFQTQLLHYFSKSDNKSNHHQGHREDLKRPQANKV